MSTLVLELKQGEVMILNGATLRFKTRARIELNTQARFLFGKQIMAEDEATTPAKQIYYELQTAYIGSNARREAALSRARQMIEACEQAVVSSVLRETLRLMLSLTETDSGFEVLKLARQMIRYETSLSQPPPEPRPGPMRTVETGA